MIRPDDFDVEIGQSERGLFIRVTHQPTGQQRFADPVNSDAVAKTRDSLIAALHRTLYDPEEIRVEHLHVEGGDSLRVAHTPSGIERWSKQRGKQVEAELLDEIIEELFSRESNAGRVCNRRHS